MKLVVLAVWFLLLLLVLLIVLHIMLLGWLCLFLWMFLLLFRYCGCRFCCCFCDSYCCKRWCCCFFVSVNLKLLWFSCYCFFSVVVFSITLLRTLFFLQCCYCKCCCVRMFINNLFLCNIFIFIDTFTIKIYKNINCKRFISLLHINQKCNWWIVVIVRMTLILETQSMLRMYVVFS